MHVLAVDVPTVPADLLRMDEGKRMMVQERDWNRKRDCLPPSEDVNNGEGRDERLITLTSSTI